MTKPFPLPADPNYQSPEPAPPRPFNDAEEAVAELTRLYDRSVAFLSDTFDGVLEKGLGGKRYRAYYPEISLTTATHAKVDSRLAFGHVARPGRYAATITRPDLFHHYLIEQIDLLIRNHGQPVTVSDSTTPIPLHFAFGEGSYVDGGLAEKLDRPLRDIFDVPDLEATDDRIVNGNFEPRDGEALPLAPFTAQRVDYSLHRLSHYTATRPEHFQNFVLFTNYQFYVDEFCMLAREMMAEGGGGYTAFVEPGNVVTPAGTREPAEGMAPLRLPQMPAYHLKRDDGHGITMVNIGVGPSNAKTITDHIAVLRPHAWLMLGHCAGLRNSQELGDYVLAHAYVREDHVLDADLPLWVPIPALAEVQVALEQAVEEITGLSGYELKKIMRTGTVATIDNRNWELRDHKEPVERLSQSRAIALDMESATIAANGFRFRVPYGTLLCVSDKPLHGELKLPGMATEFYKRQVSQHLRIGMRALELMSEVPSERVHSRKLRSFFETAFQ
ncbi:AMP nucleosidase [Aurantimonas sp. C2-6-R+9]|uniref:AMP nucleosidase n=1 Tax=unclassified Aurantimonas TaxID=2638230 RepID=UPI002E19C9AE|nr:MULTISPECIES: AMP nucleosidase [unclassified Aurantimonas]MEC5290718.1 AMP nucleosidase [Aurantimonas sp. C2-3-R2]MEC5324544.1 AMP nucleosidase [Aurantimonas sp. A3-2-R12]MEC5380734.1 AMP nucleosidase [Aurantimonas sp. C2-6-R+9]MEC5411783.1 AMP nucleosidase [Aurantimonas sp. C2-4-R8]